MIEIVRGIVGGARDLNEAKGDIKGHVLDNDIDVWTRQASVILSQSTIFVVLDQLQLLLARFEIHRRVARFQYEVNEWCD